MSVNGAIKMSVTDGIGNMNLTKDEVLKIKKAFHDPEFRRLFKEYADEISDTQNRKKYEEEIKLMEMEQGMDVQFINPTPGYCLKSRHWKLPNSVTPALGGTEDESESDNALKVFINVCKSEKVACPTMKAVKNNVGKQIPNGCVWELPHCFTPPRDELDKNKRRATVYDVSFHPKAFDLALTSPAIRRLIDVTAIEGIQRQYNLCLGKTCQQAKQLAQILSNNPVDNSGGVVGNDSSSCNTGAPHRTDIPAREDAILRCVHRLKGISYKGAPRPAVIRRRLPDYEHRQKEWKKREEDDLNSCEDPQQREMMNKLANFSKLTSSQKMEENSASPKSPSYTIIQCSDFDMLNCRDAPDVLPVRPPDRLRITVHLPGIISAGCLDLDVTATHLCLQSEKPIAYKLDLKLPYTVDHTKGEAKFDKHSSQLNVTVPLLKNVINDMKVESGQHEAVEAVNTFTEDANACSVISEPDSQQQQGEKQRHKKVKRKKNKKRSKRHSPSSSSAATSEELSPSTDKEEDGYKSGRTRNSSSPTSFESCGTQDTLVAPIPTSAQPPTEAVGTTDISAASVSEATASSYTIPISQVGIQQLSVTKDRRLAPVCFRQDPLSLSILLKVRGILRESMHLQWAIDPSNYEDLNGTSTVNTDQSSSTIKPLILLITFSSRGAGGCTMDWGLVVRCPSTPSDETGDVVCREQFSPPETVETVGCSGPKLPYKHFYNQAAPRLIKTAFTSDNVVLVLAKPPPPDCEPKMDKPYPSELRRLLSSQSVWWRTVAVGRTLTAGMQQCCFAGIDGCFQCPPQPDQFTLRSDLVSINQMNEKRCEIDWYLSGIPPPPLSAPPTTSAVQPTGAQTHPPGSRGRLRRDSAPLIQPILRSILKQRSFSESSGDEQIPLNVGCLRDAGVAHTCLDRPLSSDEFPDASSANEDVDAGHVLLAKHRSSRATWPSCRNGVQDKNTGSTNEEINCPVGSRQRLRSVNFYPHDQQLDYSPRDTVATLHHALVNRRKKAKRRATRRRHASTSDLSNQISWAVSVAKSNVATHNVPVVGGDIVKETRKKTAVGQQSCSKNNSIISNHMEDDVTPETNPISKESISTVEAVKKFKESPLSNGSHCDRSQIVSEASQTTDLAACLWSGPTKGDMTTRPPPTMQLCALPMLELDED